MKHKSIYGWLAVAVLATSLWNVPTASASEIIGKEIKIKGSSPEPSNTSGIDLSGDYAVWVTNGDKEEAIVVHNRDTGKETKIVANGKKKSFVSVDGNNVTWLEDSKIYLYDISTSKTTQISSATAKPVDLDINGNYIVWTDVRSSQSNIYSYNLKTKEETKVTSSNKASAPSVDGTYIVWEDSRNTDSDIYYYDLSAKKEGRATKNKYNQSNPSIDDGTIVFEDRREGISHIYSYDISRNKEEQITDDTDNDSENPMIYGNYVVYTVKDSLYYYNIKKEQTEMIENDMYDRIIPVIYDEDVLFATRDDDENSLYMYNIEDEELEALGGNIGDPGQPDASDKFVVFISEGKQDQVVLYDVASSHLKTISPSSHEPDRPIVSNTYAVWFDKEEEDLFAYNTKTETVKKATPKSSKPIESLYEIDGNNLFWVEEDGSDNVLNLTNLATGVTKEIDETNKDVNRIDIAGDRVMWMLDGKGDQEINYFDFKENDEVETISEKDMSIEDASLSENYIVWSTKVDKTMDLYYYDFDKDRVYSVFDKAKGDQERPQISRNMILFEDNEYSRNKDEYEYLLYDLDEEEYSDVKFSEYVDPSEVRIGGNRVVWVDGRDKDDTIYMMAFDQPKEDTETPGGDVQEFTLEEIIENDTIDEIFENNDPQNVVFIFYKGTSKEVKYNLVEIANNIDEVIELLEKVALDEVIVQVLP